MQRKPSLCAVLLLVSLLVFQGLAPDLQAQGPPPPTPQQLDQLLARDCALPRLSAGADHDRLHQPAGDSGLR